MNLTKGEAAMLGRRRQRPTLAPGELLAVFITKTLVNPKNASRGWQQKAWGRYKREWREAVAQALLEARWRELRHRLALTCDRSQGDPIPSSMAPWDYVPHLPKRVVFHATVPREFDADGLQLALAPALDTLLVVRHGAGVLSDDAPSHGHLIDYTQDVQPKRGTLYGVRIGVSLLARLAVHKGDTPWRETR